MRITRLFVSLFAVALMTSLTIAQDAAPVEGTADKAAPQADAAVDAPPAEAEAADAPAETVDADATNAKPDAESKDLSGWWTGTWLSHTNGHNGPINGYFTKRGEDHYCVHFNGMFWEIFPFQYNVVLAVTERDEDSVTMSGSSSLGLLFGTFSYTAKVTEKDFTASYCSNLDQGVFSMTRWQPCEKVEEKAATADEADSTEDATEAEDVTEEGDKEAAGATAE